jgi:hypothetical protein
MRMTTPSTTIYVRPGLTSGTWTYNGANLSSSTISAVSFSIDTSMGQQLTRGDFQYSSDNGQTWTTYVLETDTGGRYVPAAGTLWRFVDHDSSDAAASFTMHWQLADGTTVVSSAAVVMDDQPLGIIDDRSTILCTLHNGDAVTLLTPIDTGSPTGGRWVIEDQSQPGLFAVSVDPDTGAAHLVVADAGAMPLVDQAVTVSVHYYDRYQLDASGTPFANTGVSETFAFTVLRGTSQDLDAFGPDLQVGPAAGTQAAPALANLSGGGFATVWQGSDGGLWAQVRDAGGTASGAAFALAAPSAGVSGAPAVSALAGGGFVVGYTAAQGGGMQAAYRIVDAAGHAGPQVMAGAQGDASEASVATLSDGSFVLAWRSGGQVHLQHAGASGAIGAEQIFGTLGTAFSPSVSALHNGGYVVSWGEIGDGNVYAALGSAPGAAPIAVSADGGAASISTAAPLPHVAALAGGGFVVAWDSYSNDLRGFSMSDIFYQRYDNSGHALGAVAQANVDSGGGRYDAAIAALADGGFVIGWQAQGGDGDANGVFGRRFGADGGALDAHEFQVNQQAQGDQSNPALAVLGNGGVVAAWVDTQQGASSIEVRVLAGSGGTAGSGQDGGSGGAVTGSTPPAPPAPPAPVTPPATSPGTDTGSGGGSSTVTTPPVPEVVKGTDAGNVFTGASGNHAIDGGGGLDTIVYQGAHTGYVVAVGAAGVTVNGAGVGDTLVNIERVQFSDAALAFDIDGSAGQAYRLYQAAFDRAPDAAGLGYWIKAMDSGMGLDQVSAAFAGSKEFADLYGANASDSQFVTQLYQNVLHRPAEAGGYDFWMAAIEQHGVARADVLSHFSESVENQAQVIGSIHGGMMFTPWA